MADQGHAEVANSDIEAPESPASLARRERLNLLQLVSGHLHLTNSPSCSIAKLARKGELRNKASGLHLYPGLSRKYWSRCELGDCPGFSPQQCARDRRAPSVTGTPARVVCMEQYARTFSLWLCLYVRSTDK